jgi:hypothetical protein
MFRRVAFFATAFLLTGIAACGRPDSAGTPGATSSGGGASGVRGTATVDVGCPVLENASPCPRVPLRARVLVFRVGAGDRVAVVETGDDGRFEIALAPGRYELRGESPTGQPVPVAMPTAVTVPTGAFADVPIRFDSGVRGAPLGN